MCPEVDSVFNKQLTEAILHENDDNVIRNYFQFSIYKLKEDGKLNNMSDEDLSTYVNKFSSEAYRLGSSLMTNNLYELAANPKVQDELKNEIDSFPSKGKNDFLTAEMIDKMEYLDCTVRGEYKFRYKCHLKNKRR